MADPHRTTSGIDRSIKSFSGGLGVKLDRFFADFGAVFSSTEGTRSPYFSSIKPDPVAVQKLKIANYILTLGFTF